MIRGVHGRWQTNIGAPTLSRCSNFVLDIHFGIDFEASCPLERCIWNHEVHGLLYTKDQWILNFFLQIIKITTRATIIEVMKLRMDNDIFSSQISRLYLFLYVFF